MNNDIDNKHCIDNNKYDWLITYKCNGCGRRYYICSICKNNEILQRRYLYRHKHKVNNENKKGRNANLHLLISIGYSRAMHLFKIIVMPYMASIWSIGVHSSVQ